MIDARVASAARARRAEASVMSAPIGPRRSRRRLASGLGAVRALVRLVCSFVSVKLTAVYLGAKRTRPGCTVQQLHVALPKRCQSRRSIQRQGVSQPSMATMTERRRRLLGTLGKVGIGLGIPTALAVIVSFALARDVAAEGRQLRVGICAGRAFNTWPRSSMACCLAHFRRAATLYVWSMSNIVAPPSLACRYLRPLRCGGVSPAVCTHQPASILARWS